MKKAAIEMEKIVIAILVLVVLFVMIVVFTKIYGKESDTTNRQVDCVSKDSDNDGVNDFIDKCCNTGAGEDVGFTGCKENEIPQKGDECDCKKEK